MILTIDIGAIANRVRRALFSLFGTPTTPGRCHECGKALSFDECQYYATTCERCEAIRYRAL